MTLISIRCIALFCSVIAMMLSTSRANSQVVQLPSTRVFSYSGSVLVPDGGSALLGGNSSAVLVPGGRALSTRSLRAHATIIDLDAMDRAILGYDPRQGVPPSRIAATSVPATGPKTAKRQPTIDHGWTPVGETMPSAIEKAKALVRRARGKAPSDPETSKATYRLAIEILDRLALVPARLGTRLHVSDAANPLRDEASFLAKAARREFFGRFPAERLAPLTNASMARSRGAASDAMHTDLP